MSCGDSWVTAYVSVTQFESSLCSRTLIQYMGISVVIALTSFAAPAETPQVVECLNTKQVAGRAFSLIGMIVLIDWSPHQITLPSAPGQQPDAHAFPGPSDQFLTRPAFSPIVPTGSG